MRESEFNADIRRLLRAHGYRVTHIREADTPGVLDLLIWKGTRIVAWMELKVDMEPLRASQTEFIREERNNGGRAIILRLQDSICRLDDGSGSAVVLPDYKAFDWKQYLDKGKKDGRQQRGAGHSSPI